jgi:hypothetical protein
MAYRSLVVPCCKVCNNNHLSKIESKIRLAVELGPVSVSRLDPVIPFLWLGKIFYGILYLENLLRADRKSSSQRKIMHREALKQLWLHHYYLQGARRGIQFTPSLPASIFVFGTLPPSSLEEQFDFMDLHQGRSIAIRMGVVGLVAAFQDGGVVKQFHKSLRLSSHFRKPLHPVQFGEMAAQICYKAFLFNKHPRYMIAETDSGIQVVQMPVAGGGRQLFFDEWDMRQYVEVLSRFLRIPFGSLYVDGRYYSFLRDRDGKFPPMDPDAVPWFVVPS